MFFVIAGVDTKDSALEGVLEGINDFDINWSWASYAESMALRDGIDDFPYIFILIKSGSLIFYSLGFALLAYERVGLDLDYRELKLL